MRPFGGLRSDGGGLDWPRALLLALAVTVLLALGTVAATSSTAFGPYNPSWDGSSEFRQDIETDPGVEHHLVRDTAQYEPLPANETVAFVIAPDEPYDGEDAARMREFVAAGGTLVVLENFDEQGNTLLATVGAEARTNGQLLRDERYHFQGPEMPIAAGIENHTLTTGVDRLTLNYATAVAPGNATVLVRTSDFAYLGPAANELDQQDDLRSYPVATVENVSDGRVVVIGDPSITINAMYTEPDNAAFVQRLYADAEHVIIDRSHGTELPPLMAAVLTVRQSPLLQLLVGAIGIGLVALLPSVSDRTTIEAIRARLRSRGRPTHRRPGDSSQRRLFDADRAAYLRDRHPEWDEERIQRVITALNHPHPEEESHE